jgi:hypothetical protein
MKIKRFFLKLYLSYYLGVLEFFALSKKFNSALSCHMDRVQQAIDKLKGEYFD